jgi:diadenosine tetraphosphatase ApaH/serine/threonine PP2A family protein phosphatase
MKPGIPENTRIYAIGDIHGCSDLLETLLDQITADNLIRADMQSKKLVFLGDYIDRGPDSARVIDILMRGLPDGYEAIFLKGNHEAMLLEALEDSKSALFWMQNGGRETIASYAFRKELLDSVSEPDTDDPMPVFAQHLPPEHLDFLTSLQHSYQCGDYFFAHAGVHPDRPLNEQKDRDLMWIRDRFLFSEKDFGKTIVHGHTPTREVDTADNRIGIDTAAVYGGKLTALMLEGQQRKFLSAYAKKMDDAAH